MANARNNGTTVRLKNTLLNLGCIKRDQLIDDGPLTEEELDKVDWDKASQIPPHELRGLPNCGAKTLELLRIMIENHKNNSSPKALKFWD